MNDLNKVILTDVDGVLLNWSYAFNIWMNERGYKMKEMKYDIHESFNMDYSESKRLIRFFNESAAIGFLPPLRDSIQYVQKLHKEYGYVFHVITSLSLDPNAQRLRTKNLKKIFGKNVFEKFIYLDTGADKEEVLKQYEGSGYLWVEDKIENAIAGEKFGLDSILVEHGYNMHNEQFPLMKNWKEIYEYVT